MQAGSVASDAHNKQPVHVLDLTSSCPLQMPNSLVPYISWQRDLAQTTALLETYLCLAVRAQPWACSVLADLCELVAQLCGQHVSQGHQLSCLISGITKHVTLVTCKRVTDTHNSWLLRNIHCTMLPVQHMWDVCWWKTPDVMEMEKQSIIGGCGGCIAADDHGVYSKCTLCMQVRSASPARGWRRTNMHTQCANQHQNCCLS